MIRALRKKLLLIYLCSTGVILTCVIAVLLVSNVNTKKQAEKEMFQSSISSIVYLLKNETVIRRQLLYEFETTEQMMIRIEDNGELFSFPGAWEAETDRETLFGMLLEASVSSIGRPSLTVPYSETVVSSGILTIQGEQGDTYYGQVNYIPTNKNTWTMAAFLYYVDESVWYSPEEVIPYLIMEMIGLCALFILGTLIIRKALQPVAQNMQKQKEFIASASHELKSPLAVIQASSSAIKMAPDRTADFLKIIESESSSMSRLIQDMLFLASGDAQTWTLNMEMFSPESLLIDVYETYYPYCKKKEHHLSLELSDDIFTDIKGDKERLKQVCGILIDNAVSYSGKGTDIVLKLEQSEKNCVIRVIDHGLGIPDEEKEMVFDRFYRSDQSRSDKKHFGLGLSIAYSIIELHDGNIRAEDTEGGGTTFIIRLKQLQV